MIWTCPRDRRRFRKEYFLGSKNLKSESATRASERRAAPDGFDHSGSNSVELNIAGRKAIVCASSQGLGLACATSLAREACR